MEAAAVARRGLVAAWVDTVDAAYSPEPDEGAWLRGVLEAASALLPDSPLLYGMTYDASRPDAFDVSSIVALRAPDGADGAMVSAGVRASNAGLSADEVRHNFWATRAGTASELLGARYDETLQLSEIAGPFGIRDSLGISAPDPSRRGVAVIAGLDRPQHVPAERRRLYLKLAAHLASALRLRRARAHPPSIEDGEAILDRNGRVVDARGPARERANRDAIVEAARSIVRAHELTAATEKEATHAWRALTQARWSIVQRIDVDGRTYFVAVENEVSVPSPDALTARERAVLAFAAMGHSTKAIAYDLGMSTAGVGRALNEAQRKLGMRSRTEVISLFAGLLGTGAEP